MVYYSYIKDIDDNQIYVTITLPNVQGNNIEITLADTPITITQESEGLFAPIKSCSCTINIRTDGAMLDLYTINPQEVMVEVYNTTQGYTLFRGYATPCQYEQDWTSIDTLSLECVDMLSSLKAIPYACEGNYPSYYAVSSIICFCLQKAIGADYYDSIVNSLYFYWPQEHFHKANGITFDNSRDFIYAVELNEANFFDDDDQKTPWSCYEVLEEICKYFAVSLVPYNGDFYFIDYLWAATNHIPYYFWRFNLDNTAVQSLKGNRTTISVNGYAGGTTQLATDDLYNKININTNRYDIDELASDIYDENNHISITQERDFGGQGQHWGYYTVNFWGDTDIEVDCTVFKRYCRLNPTKSSWNHTWYNPMDPTQSLSNYYYQHLNQYGYTHFTNLPENYWINTLGATIVEYAVVDNTTTVPSSLDWNSAIMFQCMTDCVQSETAGLAPGNVYGYDLMDGRFELPCLKYTAPCEMCYSPKDGKSWIIINNKLWYQQNKPNYWDDYPSSSGGSLNTPIVDLKEFKTAMFPIEDATDLEGYYVYLHVNGYNPPYMTCALPSNGGWELMKYRLKIGDKYWNGNAWTTTASDFYIKYSGYAMNDKQHNDYCYTMLSWMDIVNNRTYQDSIGTNGYAIPIEASDQVKGVMELTLYLPRLIPHGQWDNNNSIKNTIYPWWEFGPCVYMKDLKVEYVYTDTAVEWWMDKEVEKDDVKYSNETKDQYKYERNETFKINSWQQGRPIAKSFPIIDFTVNNTHRREYLTTIADQTYYWPTERKQEDNIITRELRHYADTPKQKVQIHRSRSNMMNPWEKVDFNSDAQISGYFLVDKQEFDVKYRNNTIDLVEFGDATIYASND